jgi:hypothetical protein
MRYRLVLGQKSSKTLDSGIKSLRTCLVGSLGALLGAEHRQLRLLHHLKPVLRIRIRIRIRIHRIHMFLGLPDPDPMVRGMDPDPDPALDPDPDPSIIMQK